MTARAVAKIRARERIPMRCALFASCCFF